MSDLGALLRAALQGASNSAASTVSAPVDAISWGLRKAGMGNLIGGAPVGGSDWMEQRGLTRQPQNALAGDVGNLAGSLLPMGVAAKAPQIANGLLRMGENALAPTSAANLQRGAVNLKAADRLFFPRAPTAAEMSQHGRIESVPLADARATQGQRQWQRFDAGDHPPPMVAGYADKPVAVRLENGEVLVYDGHHRADLAMMAGQQNMDMHVIDARRYDPANAGRKPAPSRPRPFDDDELLRALTE